MVRPTTPMQRKAYGVKVRKAREALKLPCGAIASKLGQPVWMLFKVEVGEPVVWHPNTYKKLEEVLGIAEKAKECESCQ
jgi:ribosome-binding protein aMBF1 (putative translation factor)